MVKEEDKDTLISMEEQKEANYGSIGEEAVNQDIPLQPQDLNVFGDTKTTIDFVLVWEEPIDVQKEESNTDSIPHGKCRDTFLSRLQRSGLLIEKRPLECAVLLRRGDQSTGATTNRECRELELV